jgi:molybdate transport system ATP-binding protein
LPTHRRPLGYVFQEASLFAHLNVEQNLRFGLNRSAQAAAARFGPIVDMLGIGHLLARLPAGLSGGERQRVAIARALLTAPKLLLMDEPLAALDLKRKQEILPYLERLHRELDIPVIYVSHSPDEVARLADHLVLLDQGKVTAQGPLSATMSRLDLPAFADDAGVVIEGRLQAPAPQDEADFLSQLAFAGGSLWIAQRREAPGTPLRCRIHARDVSLARHAEDSSILNRFAGVITGIAETDTPAHVLVRLDINGTPLLARITRRSARHLALVVGDTVIAQIKTVALLN